MYILQSEDLFLYFPMWITLSLYHLWKNLFPLILMPPLSYIVLYRRGSISGLSYSAPFCYLMVPGSIPYCLNAYSFITIPDI